jgi:pimeloyl-ACP methyl ester carboxylesterase
VRSVLVNQCGYGASECPAADEEGGQWLTATKAAVAWARAHGARQVTLVGASAGGMVALQAAVSIRPPVDAVVDLSGELRWSGLDSLAAAGRLQVPALFAVAPGDSYVSGGTMRRLYQATSIRSKRLVVLAEGAGHGWELLGGTPGTDWSPLAVTVAAPSGQIPPPWSRWENEAPATRTTRSPSQAACSGLRVGGPVQGRIHGGGVAALGPARRSARVSWTRRRSLRGGPVGTRLAASRSLAASWLTCSSLTTWSRSAVSSSSTASARGEVVGFLVPDPEQHHRGGRGAGMGQVAVRMQAGDLADCLR